jgi:hypothetical protein
MATSQGGTSVSKSAPLLVRVLQSIQLTSAHIELLTFVNRRQMG